MSTINKRDTSKLAVLLQADRSLFHTNDLRLLWGIPNPQTLRQSIARYTKKGVLIPIYRGFYSTKPLVDLHPLALGSSAWHEYCYVSCETVLVQNGLMFQQLSTYTYCSSKTKTIIIQGVTYKSRQLQSEFLYNPVGIVDQNEYRIATPERAVADMLYYNPRYYFDSQSVIDWQRVKQIQTEVGYV